MGGRPLAPPGSHLQGLCPKAVGKTRSEVCIASTCKRFAFQFLSLIEDQGRYPSAARGDSGSCRCGDVRTPSPSPPHCTEPPFSALPVLLEAPDLSEMGIFAELGFAQIKPASPAAEEGLVERVALGMLRGHGVTSTPDPFPAKSPRKFPQNQFSLNFPLLCHKAESVSPTGIKQKSPATPPRFTLRFGFFFF